MKKCYPNSFLIQYLYGETSLTKTLEIEYAIQEESKIRDQFNLLKQSKDSLPKVLFFPKDKTMNSIMEYSKTSACH